MKLVTGPLRPLPPIPDSDTLSIDDTHLAPTQIAARIVERERGEVLAPDTKRARRYASLYKMYLELGQSMEPIFERRSWGETSSSS